MKVVFYSVSVSPYGAPTSLLNLIEGAVAAESLSKIYVVVPKKGPLTDALKNLDVTIIQIPFYKWTFKRKYYLALKQKSSLYAWLWFVKNSFQKFLLNFLYLPIHVIKMRSLKPDLIYVNASMSPMGIVVANLLKIKSIWHHRETLNDSITDFYVDWNPRLAQKVLNLPDARIYNSQFLKDMFDSTFSTFLGRTFVVYNGVPTSDNLIQMKKGAAVFGMVGKIGRSDQKGHVEVVQIFGEHAVLNATLNVYGSGEAPYVRSLEALVKSDNVKFKGLRKQAEIFNEIDFLIVNSRNESFGRVVAEAYAYGVPVLAYRSGALPEIVDNELTGFVYSDREGLVEAIVRASKLKGTSDYYTMQQACRAKYKKMFTIEAYTSNIVRILNSIANA